MKKRSQHEGCLEVGTARARPGEKRTGVLSVPPGFEEELLPVDVTVINGDAPGPIIYIGAGTHGDEFNSMEVARRLALELEPGGVRGAVIVLPCHNRPALESTCRHSPTDGKDLDDCFPGRLDGTASDALAHMIFHGALLQADYMIDMHTASKNGCNMRYATVCPLPADICEASHRMVRDFGAGLVFQLKAPGPGEYLGQNVGWNYSGNLFVQAAQNGIPGSIIEYGEAGRLDPAEIDAALEGVYNMLRGLGVLEGAVTPHKPYPIVDNVTVRNKVQGLFYNYGKPGQPVAKGDLLAQIIVYPDRITDVYSPCDGMIIRVATEALVKPDTRLFVLGIKSEAPVSV